ncbi:MAG: hypothetical protein NC102_06490, partial [Clostridium sp.]|nr:hypothetical protein [Clostridium sp.]
MAKGYFSDSEKAQLPALCRQALSLCSSAIQPGDFRKARILIEQSIEQGQLQRDRYGINPVMHNLATVALLAEKVSPDRSMALAIMLHNI